MIIKAYEAMVRMGGVVIRRGGVVLRDGRRREPDVIISITIVVIIAIQCV